MGIKVSTIKDIKGYICEKMGIPCSTVAVRSYFVKGSCLVIRQHPLKHSTRSWKLRIMLFMRLLGMVVMIKSMKLKI